MADPMGTRQAAAKAGLTYRQVGYWCRAGHIRSITATGEPFVHVPWSPTMNRTDPGGSGLPRYLDPGEVEVLLLMARLVRAGLGVKAAAGAARFMTEKDCRYAPLTGGVAIWIREGP